MVRSAVIVTSLVGAGLEQEARLLKTFLESHGVTTTLLHYTDMTTYVGRVDIMFSFEVVMPRSLGLAERNYLFPNSEWWPSHNDQYLSHFHKILCKTQDCFEIWSRKVGMDRCAFTSFEARDLYDASITRHNSFLHVAGKSERKGTEAVLQCWAKYDDLPPLTVVGSNPKMEKLIHNTAHWNSAIQTTAKIKESDLLWVMNANRYHLAPSEYEGFGHTIHEGLGCNAYMVTTDAPPMNAYDGVLRASFVPVAKKIPAALATLNIVDADGVYTAVRKTLETVLFDEDAPRKAFLRNRDFFRHALWDEINQ